MRILIAATALAMMGEGLALAIGVRLSAKPRVQEWRSSKNELLLLLDILLGLVLLETAIVGDLELMPVVVLACVGIALLTHFYRGVECIVSLPNPFCSNMPRLIVNMLKLLALLIIFAYTLA